MKKITLITTAILMYSFAASAQVAAKSIYAEIGGPGLASINYDMRFQPKEDGLGFRVGLGGFSIDGVSTLTVPLGINYLLGKDQKNYFEVGGGFTYVKYSDDIYTGDNFSSSFGHLTLGYRLQPKNGGFLFRANIVPVFGKGFFIPYYAGVSFGYKF